MIMGIASGLTAQAADFFCTAERPTLMDMGLRVGVNTSNRTVSETMPGGYQHQNWGTGIDIGMVVDLNIKDFISLQPGLFFESRSGSYTFITPKSGVIAGDDVVAAIPYSYDVVQAGNRRSYGFTIPLLCSLRFNVDEHVRWSVDLGPYLAFTFGSKLNNKELLTTGTHLDFEPPFQQKAASTDFGLKFGTGFEFYRHYYVGVHYQAGLLNAWKDLNLGDVKQVYGGRNKAWLFSVGYNF